MEFLPGIRITQEISKLSLTNKFFYYTLFPVALKNITDEQRMPAIKSVVNWIESSNYDIKTADYMFETKRYVYVLFMCHLATEKLIKAL